MRRGKWLSESSRLQLHLAKPAVDGSASHCHYSAMFSFVHGDYRRARLYYVYSNVYNGTFYISSRIKHRPQKNAASSVRIRLSCILTMRVEGESWQQGKWVSTQIIISGLWDTPRLHDLQEMDISSSWRVVAAERGLVEMELTFTWDDQCPKEIWANLMFSM